MTHDLNETQMSRQRRNYSLRLVAVLVLSIAFIETLIMFALPELGELSVLQGAIIDTGLLCLFTIPLVLKTVVHPLQEAAARRDELTLLETLLARAPVGVVISVDGVIRFANPKVQEILGMRIGDNSARFYVNRDDREVILTNLVRHKRHDFESLQLWGASGEIKEMIGSLSMIEYQGKPAILAWMTDISSVREAEQKMKEAKKLAERTAQLKSDFLANMSHEIRTPMNAIIGMTHLALKTDLSSRQRDYLTKVDTASQHLLGVIDDILDVSKIESGKFTIETIGFELDQVIEKLATLTANKALARNLRLTFSIDPRLPRALVGDPLRLGQILLNYVNNAVKFTEQGAIDVSIEQVEEDGREIVLRGVVRDTGIGLTPDQRAVLFKSFAQADTSTTRKYGGTGLGLLICKKLAELMGGSVDVESDFGKGSAFSFTARLGRATPPQRKLSTGPQDTPPRILIVDDSEAPFGRLAETLTEMGFEVAAASAENAFLLLADPASRPAVIMADLRNPDGLEFYRRKAALALEARAHCVGVADYGSEAAYLASDAVGASALLIRPFSAETLFNTLSRILRRESAAANPGNAHSAAAMHGLSALLVEDNEINQQIAREILEDAGIRVDIAENGRIGVEKVRSNDYDFVLMDVQMPVMDGFEATRLIRSDPRFASLPIIAMTASVMQQDRERCYAAGMNDHVSKPVDRRILFETLSKWTDRTACEERSDATHAIDGNLFLFSDVDGFDASDGLGRALGKWPLYEGLLQRFLATQATFAPEIEQALSQDDPKTAGRLAHTLKGVAGNIGAYKIHDLAAELETALSEGCADDEVASCLATLSSAVEGLSRELENRLAHTNERSDARPEDELTDLIFGQLENLLVASDAEACELLSQYAPALRRAFGRDYRRLEQAVASFDFEGALAIIREREPLRS